jgi:hypothetical protein
MHFKNTGCGGGYVQGSQNGPGGVARRFGSDVLVQLVPLNMESNAMVAFSCARSGPHLHKFCWKELAPANMPENFRTLLTFQSKGSLNAVAPANRNDRSVTLSPRHQSPIGYPYSCARELYGNPLGSARYDWTAFWSSLRDARQACGTITIVGGAGGELGVDVGIWVKTGACVGDSGKKFGGSENGDRTGADVSGRVDVGDEEGTLDGASLCEGMTVRGAGCLEGAIDGRAIPVGPAVGAGAGVGDPVNGTNVGIFVGACVGGDVIGRWVGLVEGTFEGIAVVGAKVIGAAVTGATLGFLDGTREGTSDGESEGAREGIPVVGD